MAKRKGKFRTRHKIGKTTVYAIRDAKGRFVDIQSISRAQRRDRASKSKHKVKPGQGWRGDTNIPKKSR